MAEKKEQEVIEINVQAWMVPLSILVAGALIAGGLYFGLNGKDNGGTKNNDTNNAADNAKKGPFSDSSVVAATISIDNDPYLGDRKKAKYAIVEFSDYECPFCKRHVQQVYPDIKKNYIDSGEFIYVFRDLPLSFHEPNATNEAMAGQCVFDQLGNEKYFEFHDTVYNTTQSNKGLTEEQLMTISKGISGIDAAKFDDCYKNAKFADEIKKDAADANVAGIGGTPGFIVGKLADDGTVTGYLIPGAYPFSMFKEVVDYLKKN